MVYEGEWVRFCVKFYGMIVKIFAGYFIKGFNG